MQRFFLFVISTSSLLFSQKAVEPPKIPERIRVGPCMVQQAYLGPARQWHLWLDSLSDEQIADLERALSSHPEDTCSRGYLIAHDGSRVPRRLEHALWMIQNYPQWDGFLLGMFSSANDQIRAAWLHQVGPDQRSGTALHNAAIFFEASEPDRAEVLLKRAIALEPEVPFHMEGLGILYARSQFGVGNLAFATHARSELLSSSDWLLVGGALNDAPHSKVVASDDFGKLLLARLRELAGNRDALDLLKDLPSKSERYVGFKCAPIPLLNRCVDRQS